MKKFLKISKPKIKSCILLNIIFSFIIMFFSSSAMAGIDDDFYIDASNGTYDSSSDWKAAKDLADDEMGRNGHPELQFKYENQDVQNAMDLRANEHGYTSSDNSRDVYEILEIKNTCSIDTLKKQYMDNTDSKGCWYCNIVSTMTAAYLEAVANVMNIVETLGRLILYYGFLIWLAYYVLQQVSSLAPIKPGKMLQDILLMGFKVLLATLAVRQGIPLLTEFFLDPVMLFGIDYGQTILNGMMDEATLGGAS